MMMFENRIDAGKKLAGKLAQYKNKDAIVVALPRGGVVVGSQLSRALRLPLSLLIVRKLGAPQNPEFGIGSIAQDGSLFLDKNTIQQFGLTEQTIEEIITKEKKELKRRAREYGFFVKPVSFRNKIVILTDDGIATGVTAIVAIMAIKKQKPKHLILAVPGGPSEMVSVFQELVDEYICLENQENFTAVGKLYREFEQVTDGEVLEILQKREI